MKNKIIGILIVGLFIGTSFIPRVTAESEDKLILNDNINFEDNINDEDTAHIYFDWDNVGLIISIEFDGVEYRPGDSVEVPYGRYYLKIHTAAKNIVFLGWTSTGDVTFETPGSLSTYVNVNGDCMISPHAKYRIKSVLNTFSIAELFLFKFQMKSLFM